MDYSDLIASGVDAADLTRATTIPETWKQGRTAYGGLTAALCLQAAMPLAGGLPVRAAQVAFVGPVNGTVTAPNGSWTSTHSYTRTRTWIEGHNTLELLDDVYLITGNGSGVNRNEVPYSLLITTPLRVEVGCPWIVSGVLQIIPTSLDVRTVDYGNGACDSQVTVSVNGMSFTFGG